MRKLLLTFMIFAFFTGVASAADSQSAVVDVKGLVCDFCATAIKKVFSKRAEVESVDVNLTSKKITIIFKSGKSINDADLKSLIQDSGYNVVKISRK